MHKLNQRMKKTVLLSIDKRTVFTSLTIKFRYSENRVEKYSIVTPQIKYTRFPWVASEPPQASPCGVSPRPFIPPESRIFYLLRFVLHQDSTQKSEFHFILIIFLTIIMFEFRYILYIYL